MTGDVAVLLAVDLARVGGRIAVPRKVELAGVAVGCRPPAPVKNRLEPRRLGGYTEVMKLPVLLVVLCLALPAQAAETPPRSVALGRYGVIERGEGPSGQGRWTGFPISVSLHEAPLPDVIRTFAKLTGFNLILDPRVQGSVTVELEDVPWDLALHLILETHGLGAEIDGRLWAVAPQ